MGQYAGFYPRRHPKPCAQLDWVLIWDPENDWAKSALIQLVWILNQVQEDVLLLPGAKSGFNKDLLVHMAYQHLGHEFNGRRDSRLIYIKMGVVEGV